MAQLKVLLVEDDSFTLATLGKSLVAEGFLVPDPATNAADALVSFNKHSHDVLLADLDLGMGPSGAELAWKLRRLNHSLGIVFLTSYEDPRLHRQHRDMLPPGSIYLIKQEIGTLNTITEAIRKAVLNGSSQLNQEIAGANLSEIQIETLRLIAEGLSNQEIAAKRFVSEKAVEQVIKKLIELFGLETEGRNVRVLLSNAYFKLTGGKR